MKKICTGIMLLLIALLGCQHKRNNSNDQQTAIAVSNLNSYSSLLIGEWTQCYSRSKDGIGIMRNVCSTWIFYSNDSLWVDPVGYKHKWHVHDDTLYLISSLPLTYKKNSQTFTEGYIITKSEDKNFIKIELTHIESGYMYRLLQTQPRPYLFLSMSALKGTKNNSKN